ncbi:MAG: hypothetical protein GF320_22460 [Armatimonadia bacterium]|nr:hypothetical protein [Armatimonadia bacterium]
MLTLMAILSSVTTAPGSWATYEPSPVYASRAPFESVRLAWVSNEHGEPCLEMWVRPTRGEDFGVQVAMDPVPLTAEAKADAVVSRYRLLEGDERPLEYRHARGGPLLPAFELMRDFLPTADTGETLLPDHLRYLGFTLVRTDRGAGARSRMYRPQVLSLDPELLIGTGRNFRDVELERIWGTENYGFSRFTRDEYDVMIDAGINLYVVDPEQEGWIHRRPVFYKRHGGWGGGGYPATFYRSNFLGEVLFQDEPGHYLRRKYQEDYKAASKIQSPNQLADEIIHMARSTHEGRGSYGSRKMMRNLQASYVDLGDMEIVEPEIPVWETLQSAAFYELKAGLDGYVLEARMYDGLYPQALNAFFDARIPCTQEATFDYYMSLFRGAARVWNGDWGIAIYGHMDQHLSAPAMRHAYDMGARYLWYWTSDHGHHMPWPEQLELTRQIRAYARAHPRLPIDELKGAATTAIVMPYGYTFGSEWVYDSLFDIPLMSHDRLNSHGVPYRDVLHVVATEMERCVREGIEFDIVVADPRVRQAGYDEIVWALEDGGVRVDRGDRIARTTPYESPQAGGRPPRLTLHTTPLRGPAPLRVGIEAIVEERDAPVRMPAGRDADGDRQYVKAYAFVDYPPGQQLVYRTHSVDCTFAEPGTYRVSVWTWDVDGRSARRELKVVAE